MDQPLDSPLAGRQPDRRAPAGGTAARRVTTPVVVGDGRGRPLVTRATPGQSADTTALWGWWMRSGCPILVLHAAGHRRLNIVGASHPMRGASAMTDVGAACSTGKARDVSRAGLPRAQDRPTRTTFVLRQLSSSAISAIGTSLARAPPSTQASPPINARVITDDGHRRALRSTRKSSKDSSAPRRGFMSGRAAQPPRSPRQVSSPRSRHRLPSAADAATRARLRRQPAAAAVVAVQDVRTPATPSVALFASSVRHADRRPSNGSGGRPMSTRPVSTRPV